MCYSARCLWEDSMGECMYQYRIIEVKEKYEKVRCGMTIDESYGVYIDEYKTKEVKRRKEKIIYLKTKLLQKSEYI